MRDALSKRSDSCRQAINCPGGRTSKELDFGPICHISPTTASAAREPLIVMQIVILYVTTFIVFLLVDIVGLKLIVKPVFDRHVAHLFLDEFRMGVAATFYLLYVGGILWFVSIPALSENRSVVWAFGNAAVLGMIAYGTYEFTNFATLKGWAWQMVVVDIIWGAMLAGAAAVGGLLITRAVTS